MPGGKMKKLIVGAALTALGAGTACAGGVERSSQSIGILFEDGRYAEFNFGRFDPDVSGTSSFLGAPTGSGNMLEAFNTVSIGYKQALTEKLDIAVVFDQPIGANIAYPEDTSYPVAGTTAELNSNALTGFLRYKLPSNISLIGGVRVLRTSGEVYLPFVGTTYTLDTSTETDAGYILGIAWEKPEIAARVSLTYNSAITHDFDAAETYFNPYTIYGIGVPSQAIDSTFSTKIPESVNLEFQTGVAADTLLFGSVRWVNWTQFEIAPELYDEVYPEPLVFYEDNTITYNLGLGRKFNETWSGALLLGYEPANNNLTGNLGPTDGFASAGVAVTYTQGRLELTGGLTYVDIGDAETRGIDGDFTDNSGWGAGLRVGVHF